MNHVYRVINLAMKIAFAEGYTQHQDLQTICLTALLHDVCDHKYYTGDDDGKLVALKHAMKLIHDEEIMNRVIFSVPKISWSYQKSHPDPMNQVNPIELICVRDADRLDAIGAVGIARCFTFGGSKQRSLSSSVLHFDEKLFHIYTSLTTTTAKELGKERHQFMKEFIDVLGRELSLEGA
jgi:uncharacterized protein